MKFYSIECKGKLTLQKVDGLPDFDNTRDEARVVYNTNDGKIYFGDNEYTSGWSETGSIEPGTKMIFKQSSAPRGWTFLSEDNDRVLINTSTQGDGGSTGGNWTISGHSLSVSTQNHALSLSEIPVNRDKNRHVETSDPWHWSTDIATWGSARGHNHGVNSSLSFDGNWRPSYAKVITCTKD